MKQLSAVVFSILVLALMPGFAQSSKTTKSALKSRLVKVAPSRASLDELVARVDAYWNSLVQGKKARAGEYIAVADRDSFYNSPIATFSDPQLKSLELSADRKEATVTVTVKRSMPPSGINMNWPVIEHWRFEGSNWYRSFSKPGQTPFAAAGKPEPASAVQKEQIKSEIRNALKIPNSILDFGTVRENTPLQLGLRVVLSGNEPLRVALKMPEGFGVEGVNDREIIPGEHEIKINVPTWRFDGAVHERLVLSARRLDVTVPFEIDLKGFVYVPVSISSKLVEFQQEDEKELRVRNNTKSEIELAKYYSEAAQVKLDSLPVIIPPGQEMALKLKLDRASAQFPSNRPYSLSIAFAKPVDNVSSINFTVIMRGAKRKDGEIVIESDTSRSCRSAPDLSK